MKIPFYFIVRKLNHLRINFYNSLLMDNTSPFFILENVKEDTNLDTIKKFFDESTL